MADFSTPFALSGPRRNPTSDEKANGFPCGPADQTLFNGLFHRIESELGNLISYAGLSPTDANYTQVRQAVVALINAATGGGDDSDYLLISQAKSRLPFYPEVVSADGTMNVTSPANGIIRLPGGVDIIHRGVSLVTTEETDFATIGSRTYHLRWNPTDGFQLLWLGDSGYNPSGLADADPGLDSTYDDMLIARVITNSSNVPAITLLANKSFLNKDESTFADVVGPGIDNQYYADHVSVLNWARRPKLIAVRSYVYVSMPNGAGFMHGGANQFSAETAHRYSVTHRVTSDWASTPPGIGATQSKQWASFGA